MFLLIFNNMYYVYIHRKATTGEVFYVGKGHGNRAYSHSNRNKIWQHVVEKHGFIVEIVTESIQEWYAFELERDLILAHGRRIDNSGTLVNITEGGEGISGLTHSAESKKKMSDAKIGNTFMLGLTRSDSSKKKMSDAKRKIMKPVKRDDGVIYESTHAAAKQTGARQGGIVNCLKGRCHTAGGYSWSYA